MKQTQACVQCQQLAGWFTIETTETMRVFNSDGHELHNTTDPHRESPPSEPRCIHCRAALRPDCLTAG